MSERPVVVVVAAGRGSRFPGSSHKLVQALGASTVLGTTLAQVMESRLPCVVVTTPALEPEAARVLARRDLVVISQQEADKGIGHTVAAGVQARPHAPGWLLLPADMPLVGPYAIEAVAQALPQHTAVVAQHHGRRGHPVGFSSGLYSELMSLANEDGLRRLLARYPAHGVEVADAGVLFDVDTEADLEAARAMVPALGLTA
jgi:molybdenum cofactor cytidylyltransferase